MQTVVGNFFPDQWRETEKLPGSFPNFCPRRVLKEKDGKKQSSLIILPENIKLFDFICMFHSTIHDVIIHFFHVTILSSIAQTRNLIVRRFRFLSVKFFFFLEECQQKKNFKFLQNVLKFLNLNFNEPLVEYNFRGKHDKFLYAKGYFLCRYRNL